jgi:glycosyltransferase involved in cell wall biosynthesis
MRKYAEDELRGKVVFTGPMDKNVLRVLYSNAYCVVLPSLIEAFGMVILEAMASGAPPIGSIAGGIPDVIVDGVNGLLFRRGDSKDLADKILTLIEDKSPQE